MNGYFQVQLSAMKKVKQSNVLGNWQYRALRKFSLKRDNVTWDLSNIKDHHPKGRGRGLYKEHVSAKSLTQGKALTLKEGKRVQGGRSIMTLK